jgi:hypothetical protein
MAVLFALGLMLLPLVASRAQHWPDCTGRVTVIKGPHGEPIECVCVGGTLSTCFSPGP